MTEGHTGRLEAALDGKYRIGRKLGEGGMASVYLAEDIKHKRKVALKILRPELAAVIGAERFLSEIQTTANLQHPHILALFDSGEAGGYLYYVMPYIEGETLREKLEREKQLGVEESVRIAREVADALDYAHRQGVIHRDIKPGNILLHDGRPVVADFGIALAVSAAGGGRMTETGLSLGTPHYMSPEQASADRDLSARSDVYSLGCVLYEMIGGQPPHSGPSAQSILVHILTKEATPLTELRHTVPPHVAATVSKSIEKLPADRFETAKAFMDALGDEGFTYASAPRAAATPGTHQVSAVGTPRRGWAAAVPWAVAAAAAGVAMWGLVGDSEPASVTRVVLTTPEGQELAPLGGIPTTALSPDGSELVYRGPSASGTGSQLWRRRLDALEATPIAGTDGVAAPAFSRDGASLSFSQPGRWGVVSTEGGTPVWLEQANNGFRAWGDDGAIYAAEPVGDRQRLLRWIPGTAQAETYDVALPSERVIVSDVLPGSEAVLLSNATTIGVLDLESGEYRELGGGRRVRYVATGHIVFARPDDGILLVQPFDLRSLSTTGPSRATTAAVSLSGAFIAEYSLADDGTLVYSTGTVSGGQRLAWVDRGGRTEGIDWVDAGVRYDGISLDPSGRRVAASWSDAGQSQATGDVWVLDLQDRGRLRITTDGTSVRPRWHPTEPLLTYVSYAGGRSVRSIAADGSGGDAPIVDLGPTGPQPDAWWTEDGRELLLRMPGVSGRSIFRFVPGEDETPQPWLDGAFDQKNPAPSPDGSWLVYVSNRSGRDEVWAQPYPDGGPVTQISLEGGGQAVWSRDGREIFFVGSDGYMWSAGVSVDASRFVVGTRERLFELDDGYPDNGGARPLYDVSPDGRFLMALNEGGGGSEGDLVLVRNWVQESTRER